jgi:hypothetical protein
VLEKKVTEESSQIRTKMWQIPNTGLNGFEVWIFQN